MLAKESIHQRRHALLLEALANTQVDQENLDSCMEALEKNEQCFAAMKALDQNAGEAIPWRKQDEEILQALLTHTQKLNVRLREGKQVLSSEMRQVNQNRRVVKSYLQKEADPWFVDKNF